MLIKSISKSIALLSFIGVIVFSEATLFKRDYNRGKRFVPYPPKESGSSYRPVQTQNNPNSWNTQAQPQVQYKQNSWQPQAPPQVQYKQNSWQPQAPPQVQYKQNSWPKVAPVQTQVSGSQSVFVPYPPKNTYKREEKRFYNSVFSPYPPKESAALSYGPTQFQQSPIKYNSYNQNSWQAQPIQYNQNSWQPVQFQTPTQVPIQAPIQVPVQAQTLGSQTGFVPYAPKGSSVQYNQNSWQQPKAEQIQVAPQQAAAPVPAPANSLFDECQQTYQATCIAEHNRYRAKHQAPPVRTSTQLQQASLDYARSLAARNVFKHSNTKGVGENLAMSFSSGVSTLTNCAAYAQKFVKMWYDEVNQYSYSNPVFGMSTGHFTQVVWKSTTEVGCGVAIGSNGKVYGVSQYKAPGNYAGQFAQNVLPPI